MKSCVVTENFACDPMKVWLYLTKPTLNNWCKDVSAYEESSDGMTALLLGGGDSTSVECTLDVNGLGLFAKPAKLLEAHFDMLHKTLGA